MQLTRRSFMQSILAAGVAPAVIGSRILMPVRRIWTPDHRFAPKDGLPPRLLLPPESAMAFGQRVVIENPSGGSVELFEHGDWKGYAGASTPLIRLRVKPHTIAMLSNDFGKWVLAEVALPG